MISIATSVLITKGDTVLLVYEADKHKYGLPGGKLEHGESLREGAIRECKEEAGFEPVIDRLVFMSQKPTSREGNNVVRFIYEAHVDEAQPHEQAEFESHYVDEAAWRDLKQQDVIRGKDVIALIDAFYQGQLTTLPEPKLFA